MCHANSIRKLDTRQIGGIFPRQFNSSGKQCTARPEGDFFPAFATVWASAVPQAPPPTTPIWFIPSGVAGFIIMSRFASECFIVDLLERSTMAHKCCAKTQSEETSFKLQRNGSFTTVTQKPRWPR